MTGSRVAQFERIRRDAQREDLSIRELARRRAAADAASAPPSGDWGVDESPRCTRAGSHQPL